MANIQIIGVRELEAKLRRITKGGPPQVSRAAMQGAAVPLKKSIRGMVNSSSASGRMKRAARQTIGSSVKKNADKTYGMKAGLGVGKRTKAKQTRATARHGAYKAKQAKGVGISAANIHWATLGTKQRFLKKQGGFLPAGASTGAMPAILAGLVPKAAGASKPEMLAMAAYRARIAVEKLALKGR
jgi:hypothetical protein